MKLKNIFGVALCASALLFTTPVFASGETFTIGNPIDLNTGSEATELTAGQILAYPVDITTDSQIVSYQIFMQYDNTVLTPGIVDADISNDQFDNIDALGELADTNSSGLDGAIFSIGEIDRKGNFSAYGDYLGFNTAYADNVCNVGWGDHLGRNVNDTTPEFYALYTVKTSVSDEDLNKKLISPVTEKCTVGVYNVGETTSVPTNTVKANACDGAFKIVVDGSTLPYWVQGVSVNGTLLTACINEEGSTEYSFPVRLINSTDSTATSIDAKIVATVTDDEAGTINKRTVTWATVNVSVDGSVTSYSDVSSSLALSESE